MRPVLSLFHKRPSDLSALLNYCFCDKYQAPNTLYLFISIPQEAHIELSGTRRLFLSLLDLLDSFQHDTTCLYVHSLREVSLGLREGVEARRGEVDRRESDVTRREGTKEGRREMTKLLQTNPSVHHDTTSRSWPFARVGTFLCLPTLRTESVVFAACLPACLSRAFPR